MIIQRPQDDAIRTRSPLTYYRLAVKPNILLAVFDPARADAFEPYGARAGSSPAVQQLAADRFAHDATFSTAGWTVPAHGSLFSGELQRAAELDPLEHAPMVMDAAIEAVYGARIQPLREALEKADADEQPVLTSHPEPADAADADLEEQMRLLGYL